MATSSQTSSLAPPRSMTFPSPSSNYTATRMASKGFRPRSCQGVYTPTSGGAGTQKPPAGSGGVKSTRPPRAATMIADPTPPAPKHPTRGAATLVEGLICTDAREQPREGDDGETR